jgi:hypothetical protein
LHLSCTLDFFLGKSQQEKSVLTEKAKELDTTNYELLLEKKKLLEQVNYLKEKLETQTKESEKVFQQKDSSVKALQKEMDALQREIESGKSSLSNFATSNEVL